VMRPQFSMALKRISMKDLTVILAEELPSRKIRDSNHVLRFVRYFKTNSSRKAYHLWKRKWAVKCLLIELKSLCC
jgi:hypothetical protein